jgi:hypothetical protein
MIEPASGAATSAAPASMAASVISSGSRPFSGMLITPRCSNCQPPVESVPRAG